MNTPAPLRAATEELIQCGWLDQYGNILPMGAYAVEAWREGDNTKWQRVYRKAGAAPAPVAHRLEGWQSIETAPKDVVYKEGNHSYGEKILVATRAEVLRARWWFHADGYSNFIQDGGGACFPSHWMELPQLPDQGARNEQR